MNPSSNVGSIEYTSRISTDKLRQDARAVDSITSGAAKNMGDNMERGESRVSNVLGGIAGKVKAAALAIGAATAAAGAATAVFGIKSAADFEQTRIGLENMLGSADKARSLLGDISKFAAETPFEFPELAQATRQLVAFGYSGEDAFKTMKSLGDVSAAIGAPINDLAYLMGTLKTQGRAFTIDIRQFVQRGVPIIEYLGKTLNKTSQEISQMVEEGKIGFPEVQAAIEAMTSKGGKYFQSMEKQSKSLSGQFSTLKDNAGQALRELIGITNEGEIKPGSLFESLRNGVGSLNASIPSMIEQMKQWGRTVVEVGKQIGDYLGPKLSALWATIRDNLLPAVQNFVRVWGPTVGMGLVWAIGFAVDALKIFLGIISPVIQFMADNTWVVWGIVGAFVAFRAALAINAAVTAFQTGMAAITTAMAIANGQAVATTKNMKALRLIMVALGGPWQILVGAILLATFWAAFKSVEDMLNKVRRGIDDLNKKSINIKFNGGGGVDVSGGSGIGIVQQLRNQFGFRASGGPVTAGQPYIVGEKQPEVFVPRTDGTILPEVPGSGVGGASTHIGEINISNELDGNYWLRRLTQDDRALMSNLTPQRRLSV